MYAICRCALGREAGSALPSLPNSRLLQLPGRTCLIQNPLFRQTLHARSCLSLAPMKAFAENWPLGRASLDDSSLTAPAELQCSLVTVARFGGLIRAYRLHRLCPQARALCPLLSPVAGHVHREFQPAPHPHFVEGAPQMVLDHLLRGAYDPADLAVGEPLPDQNRNLDLFRCQALARGHDRASLRLNIAIASFTRLRPSRIPARRNNVRRCCFTVRGLICS